MLLSDLIFIVVLIIFCAHYVTKPAFFGDWIGCIMGNLMLYALAKWPWLILCQGFRITFEQTKSHHLFAGIMSFIAVLCFYFWISGLRITGDKSTLYEPPN